MEKIAKNYMKGDREERRRGVASVLRATSASSWASCVQAMRTRSSVVCMGRNVGKDFGVNPGGFKKMTWYDIYEGAISTWSSCDDRKRDGLHVQTERKAGEDVAAGMHTGVRGRFVRDMHLQWVQALQCMGYTLQSTS